MTSFASNEARIILIEKDTSLVVISILEPVPAQKGIEWLFLLGPTLGYFKSLKDDSSLFDVQS